MSKFSNLSLLKILRSIDLFSKLSISQLKNISDILEEISFSDGQQILTKVTRPFVISSGNHQIFITFDSFAG